MQIASFIAAVFREFYLRELAVSTLQVSSADGT
jgi:hypothetical protein